MLALKSDDAAGTGDALTPTIFTIFGATGDLAQKKLFPSFFDLYVKKILPEKFIITAFARREHTDESYRELAKIAIKNKQKEINWNELDEFLNHVKYVRGTFEDKSSYANLSRHLDEEDKKFGVCSNKLFYIAVPPNLYELIFNNLSKSGLTIPCIGKAPLEKSRRGRLPVSTDTGSLTGWTRILVEKPFGKDAVTARRLDKLLGKLFDEEQIFRIDHYLAKETIQNILVFRFSNSLFEPIWNSKHIEKIEIRMSEHDTVGTRGDFYDGIGALRDVGQNHLIEMLALVTMDYPKNYSAESIRKERAKVIKNVDLFSSGKTRGKIIRGQYDKYLNESGVPRDSETETFFSVEAEVKNSRWRGVPIELTSGKALDASVTEINIRFKDVNTGPTDFKCNENVLTFRIQPNEGISVSFWVKKPGFATHDVQEKTLSFNYSDSIDNRLVPDAYERVLYDCLHGDQTLFSSTEELEASWKFITPILENWKKTELIKYERGTKLKELIQR